MLIIWSRNDPFANELDILRLKLELKNVPLQVIEVENPKWSHIDFIFGKNAKTQVYDKVVEYIELMEKKTV